MRKLAPSFSPPLSSRSLRHAFAMGDRAKSKTLPAEFHHHQQHQPDPVPTPDTRRPLR